MYLVPINSAAVLQLTRNLLGLMSGTPLSELAVLINISGAPVSEEGIRATWPDTPVHRKLLALHCPSVVTLLSLSPLLLASMATSTQLNRSVVARVFRTTLLVHGAAVILLSTKLRTRASFACSESVSGPDWQLSPAVTVCIPLVTPDPMCFLLCLPSISDIAEMEIFVPPVTLPTAITC